MKSTVGMTLLEVLIAIAVLAVGVLAAAAMQTTALRASNDARAIQDVTEFAEREIELRRQFDLSSTAGKSTTCTSVTPLPTDYTCNVEVRNCQLSGTALSCSTGSVTTPVADQITVTIGGPREKTITLRTVKARPSS